MTTPLERTARLAIGSVESVSPSELKVQLDVDAPQSTALNTGLPVPFPRINSYVLIPGQNGALVGQVTWVGIERSPFPKRKGLKDFGLVDLPFPLRRLAVAPIGTLRVRLDVETGQEHLELDRGVSLFPSVGDPVLLPTPQQLRSIVEVSLAAGPVTIGRSALSDSALVRVHPDRLFGRHLAVLGNTGSGKSCSVAGLIRWTIEAARADRQRAMTAGEPMPDEVARRGCRFVVLDPNGEYLNAFDDLGAKVKVLTPNPTKAGADQLLVPAWLWNTQEWASILQASPGVQQPILMQAIRALRGGGTSSEDRLGVLAEDLRRFGDHLEAIASDPAEAVRENKNRSSTVTCFRGIAAAADAVVSHTPQVAPGLLAAAKAARDCASRLGKEHGVAFTTAPLKRVDIDELRRSYLDAAAALPPVSGNVVQSADQPRPFDLGRLPATIRAYALGSPDGKALQHVAYLIERLQEKLADARVAEIINPRQAIDLSGWLEAFLGSPSDSDDSIVIVDLSLVPADVTHLIVAVITRVLFEAEQRYHKAVREALPLVVVLEEAHVFIQEGRDDPSQSPSAAQMCRRTFEKVAREGRKFGVGLVLSSQRPSEISPTVLSQCNTFLLHRLVNDEDQQLVGRLVPDSLAGLLGELSILPSRYAILLGHASPIPKLVIVKELGKPQRPASSDPPLWDVWRWQVDRRVDWATLAGEWKGEK